MQRCIMWLLAARQSRDRNQQRILSRRFWHAAEDVQPVANLHFLEIAQMCIERAKRFIGRRLACDRHVRIDLACTRERKNIPSDGSGAFRIEIGGERVFIDQRFQPCQIVVQFGARHRRRQMIDNDG